MTSPITPHRLPPPHVIIHCQRARRKGLRDLQPGTHEHSAEKRGAPKRTRFRRAPPGTPPARHRSRHFRSAKREGHAPLEQAPSPRWRKRAQCARSSRPELKTQPKSTCGRTYFAPEAHELCSWNALPAFPLPSHRTAAPKAHGLRIFLPGIVGHKAYASLEHYLLPCRALLAASPGERLEKAACSANVREAYAPWERRLAKVEPMKEIAGEKHP